MMGEPEHPRALITAVEAAVLLGVDRSTVRRLVQQGHLQEVKISDTRRLLLRGEVERLRAGLLPTGPAAGADAGDEPLAALDRAIAALVQLRRSLGGPQRPDL